MRKRGGSSRKIDPDALRSGADLSQVGTYAPLLPGGILAALRRSPLVGAGLDLTRSTEPGRAGFA